MRWARRETACTLKTAWGSALSVMVVLRRESVSYGPGAPLDFLTVILEGVLDAMLLEKAEEIGGVLVDNDVLAGDMDTESVWCEFFALSLEECVEQDGNVLLGGIGKVDFDHIGHLVAIAVDEVGLEGAKLRCHYLGDIDLCCGALDFLSLLALRRGWYYCRHFELCGAECCRWCLLRFLTCKC